MPKTVKASVGAAHLRAVFHFVSTAKDTRFYLHGAFIEAHAAGGVMLTATDGHALIRVYDSCGVWPFKPAIVAVEHAADVARVIPARPQHKGAAHCYFDPALLMRFAKARRELNTHGVNGVGVEFIGGGSPNLVTLADAPAFGVFMPLNLRDHGHDLPWWRNPGSKLRQLPRQRRKLPRRARLRHAQRHRPRTAPACRRNRKLGPRAALARFNPQARRLRAFPLAQDCATASAATHNRGSPWLRYSTTPPRPRRRAPPRTHRA